MCLCIERRRVPFLRFKTLPLFLLYDCCTSITTTTVRRTVCQGRRRRRRRSARVCSRIHCTLHTALYLHSPVVVFSIVFLLFYLHTKQKCYSLRWSGLFFSKLAPCSLVKTDSLAYQVPYPPGHSLLLLVIPLCIISSRIP